ncbi:MAG: HlyD family efflux transporter periplasmic adaptor subunit [Gemmataceae bacterium]
MIRWLLAVVGAVAGLLLAWWCWPTPATITNPSRPRLPRGVAALGRLEPASRVVQVCPANPGESKRVEKLLVAEGDTVAAGAVVAELDCLPRRQAALREAVARVAVARAKLRSIESGAKADDIRAKEATRNRLATLAENAERDYQRVLRLSGGGAAAQAELESKLTQRDASRAELRQAEAELLSLRTVRREDVALAAAELLLAEAGVETARASRDTAVVRAPFAGRVLKIHAWPGERIADKGLLDLGDTTQMDAVAEVYEADIARVHIRQQAKVFIPALGKTLPGTVRHIGLSVGKKDVMSNDPVIDTDARVVEVRVALDSSSCPEVAGLTNARVEIVLQPEN